MRFTLATITLLLPVLTLGAVIPNTTTIAHPLEKRGGQVLYLANCYRNKIQWQVDRYTASYAAWYQNVDNSQNQQPPDALSSEYRNWAANGDYLHWEGQTQELVFPSSGTVIQTHINNGADGAPKFSFAGQVHRTSDGYNFNCYRDNQRELFDLVPNDGSDRDIYCWSIYYCV